MNCEPGNNAHAAIARKALSLIKKVATNRCESIQTPAYEVMWRAEKGYNFWIGHDAARWCRADPKRLLDYDSYRGFGLRPLD